MFYGFTAQQAVLQSRQARGWYSIAGDSRDSYTRSLCYSQARSAQARHLSSKAKLITGRVE
jgi:hypothetical protein